MKLIFILSLLTFISCGSKNNIFYDGSGTNSKTIGSILPVTIAPDLLIESPADNSLNGKNILVSGKCDNTETIEISGTIESSPVKTSCLNGNFSANIKFTSLADSTESLEFKAINKEKSTLRDLSIRTSIEKPQDATHIDIINTRATSVDVSWNSAGSTTLPLLGYILEYKESSEQDWVQFSNGPVTQTNAQVQNLESSTQYDFRVRATNGNFSTQSFATTTTTPIHDFFDTDKTKAINVAGATVSSLVAIEQGDFYLNDSLLATLQEGETHQFNSAQGDIITSQSAFFVAGRLGSGSDSAKGNIVWTTQDWADKKFSFSASRSAIHKLSVVAFEDSTITVKRGATVIDTQAIAVDQVVQVSLPTDANYTIESTGVISAFLYSATGNSTQVRDPRPLLPNATDLIGFPSRWGFVSAQTVGTEVSGIHSNDQTFTHTFADLSQLFQVNAQGTSDRYKSHALRLMSTAPIEAISNADFDGYAASPFLPRAKMKNTYAINVQSEWVAFASVDAGTITATKPDGQAIQLNLEKVGTDPLAPFKARATNLPAGTIFKSTVPVAAWYEPKTDTAGSNDDETLLFGFNL